MSSAPASDSRSGLGPGSVVGGRFAIERAVGDDALGARLFARDQKTQRPICVRVLHPGLIATPQAVEILREEIKVAAAIQHRSAAATYGMGAEKGGARFIATEWMDGQSLAQVVQEKKASGEPLSLRGAYNVLAHVCKALSAIHAAGSAHGALRPGCVFITKSGRVKVTEIGLARAILRTAGAATLGASEQAFLAPEVRGGATPDARADVFGLGGLLYCVLTGRSAADDFVPPSQAHPEATEALDAILLRCLAADPAARFATPEELTSALLAIAGGTEPAHDQQDFGVDVDVDVDVGSMRPAAAAEPISAPKIPAPPRGPGAPGKPVPPPPNRPQARPQAPAAKPGQPGQPAAPPRPGQPAPAKPAPARPAPAPDAPILSAEVDLGNLLSKITENDAARWMVVKEGLDHGPFSGRELVQLILKGEVLGDHGLLNMDSGERRKVKEAPEFAEFCEQYRLKKAEADHKVALERSAKVETVSAFAKFGILAGVLAVVGVGVGIYLITRPDTQEGQRADADLADLYERGEIEISGTAGILPDPPAGQRRGGGGRRAGGGGGLSYEDAMNQVVNLGDVSGGGGSQSRLSPAQVAGVMNQNINSLIPCVVQEQRAGGNLSNVRIDLAIAGSGQVLGATVRSGSGAFQSCVAGRVRRIRFPSFGAPRMGASYSFSAD